MTVKEQVPDAFFEFLRAELSKADLEGYGADVAARARALVEEVAASYDLDQIAEQLSTMDDDAVARQILHRVIRSIILTSPPDYLIAMVAVFVRDIRAGERVRVAREN